MATKHLYTYLPKKNTADVDGILSTALAPHGWEKYMKRMGVTTKEDVLKTLDQWDPGRSRGISVFTEPIGDDAPESVRAFADSHELYEMPSYEELKALKLVDRLYRAIRHRRGTMKVDHPNYRKIKWSDTAPREGGLGLSGAPHYIMETTTGKIPADLVAPKKVADARRFLQEVSDLASKKGYPIFAVTDGASITRNNNVPAIRAARDAHIEWEKSHGADPDEDWGKTASYYVPKKPLSPEQLKKLYSTFKYRVLNKETGRPYFNTEMETFDKWKSLSVDEMLKHRIGICYDTAKLSDHMLNILKIPHYNVFACAERNFDDHDYDDPTHAFTVYQGKDKKWRWLEGSWSDFKDNDFVTDTPDEMINIVTKALANDSGIPYLAGKIMKFPKDNTPMNDFYHQLKMQNQKEYRQEPDYQMKSIGFPTSELQSVIHKDKIITTRVSDEYDAYNEGDLIKSPWGDTYQVAKRTNITNVQDHPYYNELTGYQKHYLGTKDKLAILELLKQSN